MLLDGKTTAHDKLVEDLSKSHQKAIDLRRQVTSLEEQQQQSNNVMNSAKFKESALQQEVDLLKRNNEWLDNELKNKSAEHSKFRKDKNTRLSELQRANESANDTIASLQRAENSLRGRISELDRKTEEQLMAIQRMQEEKVRADEGFRAELDGARRLAQLQEQSAQTARRRVEQLDEEVEKTREEASEEISTIQSELETERNAKEAGEQKIEDLEAQIDNLQSGSAQALMQDRGPVTPRRGLESSGPFGTSPRSASPIPPTPGSKLRGNLTMTQLYSDLNRTKAELEEERRRNERLSSTFEEMMSDLEAKAPEIQDLHEDKARLEADIDQISSSLTQANQDRDHHKKDSRKWEGQTHSLVREADLLRQQLRDLSVQVKVLTVEVQIRSEGVELSHAEQQALQRAASGASDERILEGMTDTGRFISQHLTTFRNVFELQEKNIQLLNMNRQLGEQMEGEEAKAKKSVQKQNEEELEALRSRTTEYKAQLGNLQTQLTSFMKERDIYRRMCARRGQIPPGTDLESEFGETMNGIPSPSKGPPNGDVNGHAHSQDLAQESRLIKEMQLQFDAYKREASVDQETLRGQIDGLARDKSSLQGDLARAKSQVTVAQERYEMLQASYNMLRAECEELQKRLQSYAETAAKQDARTQQALEDLVQQRELENGLRGENANLKAERDLSKRMQDRLDEENRSMYQERDRLNNLLANTQRLSSERDSSFEEQRRRLQSQVDSLETDNKATKQKLDEEIESSKNASLRREYDLEQNQTRINDLMKSLGASKEELAATKTAREQLQARVEELKIELRNAQEHAQALQPRPTARSGTGAADSNETFLTREQELSIELADLRREIELAKNELENAKEQVEQYKSISESSEQTLADLQTSHEEYCEDAEKLARERDSTMHDLERRRDEISNELSVTNDQLTELRTRSDSHQTELDRQKADYDSQFARLNEDLERYKATAELRQEDVKAQAEIAQRAQQNYETELIKHGDAAKKLQEVRNELNEVKLQVATTKAETETARAQLSQSEESWACTREQLESEVVELKRRRDDIDRQNQILHGQLERVGSQINEMQKRRQSSQAREDEEASIEPDTQKYTEIIKYLRREKEIVDVQYELSLQESRRLKQQLEHTVSELNETRLRLEQERQRQQGQQSYSKLAEAINQLNIFRESNETLRNETRQAQGQLAEKVKRVDELTAQIEPLRASVVDLENQQETSQGEIKLLQEDRDRWQKRNQDILSKYDRVDPAEMQELKEKLSTLEQEKAQAVSDQQNLENRINSFQQELESAKEQSKKDTVQRMREQFVTKVKEKNEELKVAVAEKEGVQGQLDQARNELLQAQQDLTQALKDRDARQNNIQPAQQAEHASVPEPSSAQAAATQTSPPPNASADTNMHEAEEGEVEEGPAQQSQDVEARFQREQERALTLEKNVNELEDQVQALQQQVGELQTQLDAEHTELDRLRQNTLQGRGESVDGAQASTEHMQKLQTDLEAAQRELEALRHNSSTDTATGSADISVLRTQLEAEYKQKREATDQRMNGLRQQLNDKLREGRKKYKEEVVEEVKNEHEAQLANLKQEHEAELSELKAQRAQEVTSSEMSSAQAAVSQVNGDVDTKSLAAEPADVKDLVANNPTVRSMISRTVESRMRAERESYSRQVEELEAKHQNAIAELESTHIARLKELNEVAAKAKADAVNLAEKKTSVKLNMTVKARDDAKAKLEYVQKAASESPTKPIGEVWELAKITKSQAAQASISQVQTPAAVVATGRSTPQSLSKQPALKTEDPQDRIESKSQVNDEVSSQMSISTDNSSILVPTPSPGLPFLPSPPPRRQDGDSPIKQESSQARPRLQDQDLAFPHTPRQSTSGHMGASGNWVRAPSSSPSTFSLVPPQNHHGIASSHYQNNSSHWHGNPLICCPYFVSFEQCPILRSPAKQGYYQIQHQVQNTVAVPATPNPSLGQLQTQQQAGSTIPRPSSAMGIRGQARRLSNASQTHSQQQASQTRRLSNAAQTHAQQQTTQAPTDSQDVKSKLPDAPLGPGPPRGSGLPRGGTMRSRGAPRGAMNAGASTFIPGTAGQKRGFDGEQGRGGMDKKPRGRGA